MLMATMNGEMLVDGQMNGQWRQGSLVFVCIVYITQYCKLSYIHVSRSYSYVNFWFLFVFSLN